jgi:hypothetical protein
MTHATPAIICREHCMLSAMLRCIAMLLAEHRRRNSLADFEMLRAMLFYVDEFPRGLDAAFLANHDPLLDYPADEGYSALFQKIQKGLPSPLGLGSMLSALSGRSAPTTPLGGRHYQL